MASGDNKRGKKNSIMNRLITSPKQVRSRLTLSVIQNSIIANGYNHIDSNAEEIIFSKVSFCDSCTLTATAQNKLIIFEECNFHGMVCFYGNTNTMIVIRDSSFRENITVSTMVSPEFIDCDIIEPNQHYISFLPDSHMRAQDICN